jgi:hypothetical protein
MTVVAEKQIQKINLVGVVGDTWIRNVTFNYPNGSPFDLTGCTLYMPIKSSPDLDDDEADLLATVTVHTDPTNGKSQIRFEKDETAQLTKVENGNYHHCCRIKLANGDLFTVEFGMINFLRT